MLCYVMFCANNVRYFYEATVACWFAAERTPQHPQYHMLGALKQP